MASELTERHQADIGVIADDVRSAAHRSARRADVGDIDRWWRSTGPEIEASVRRGFATTAGLASQFLASEALLNGFPGLEPLQAVVDVVQIAESLRITGPVAFKTNMRRSGRPDVARRVMANRLAGSANRLTLAGSRQTIADTAEASPFIARYRRIAQSGACDFCQMLAGRGAVYTSEASAGSVVGRRGQPRGNRRIGQSYHDHCRCFLALDWVDPTGQTVSQILRPQDNTTIPTADSFDLVKPPDPLDPVSTAKRTFESTPEPANRSVRDRDGNLVPSRETQRREALRHKVGIEADDLIGQRVRERGITSLPDAERDLQAARNRLADARRDWNQANTDRNLTALTDAETGLVNAAVARDRAVTEWPQSWREEMNRLLDDLQIERGGVPIADIVNQSQTIDPQLRGRIQEALDLFPSDWLWRSTGQDAFNVIHVDPRAFMRPRSGGWAAEMNLRLDQRVDVIAHEFGHQLENLTPDIKAAEWAWYWRRAGDDPLRPLNEISPLSGYDPTEKSREDQWANAYMGKPYSGATDRSNFELFSMAAEAFMPNGPAAMSGDGWRRSAWRDDDMRQWFLSVLLTT